MRRRRTLLRDTQWAPSGESSNRIGGAVRPALEGAGFGPESCTSTQAILYDGGRRPKRVAMRGGHAHLSPEARTPSAERRAR